MKKAIQNMELWALKIMGRLYYHMELVTEGEVSPPQPSCRDGPHTEQDR